MHEPQSEAENTEANSRVDRLIGNLVEVAETRFDLLALNVQDRMTEIMATGASVAVVAVFFFFTLMLGSIGGAIYLSNYLNSPHMGFVCIAGFYLVLALLVYLNRRRWVKLPIVNFLLKKIHFHEED